MLHRLASARPVSSTLPAPCQQKPRAFTGKLRSRFYPAKTRRKTVRAYIRLVHLLLVLALLPPDVSALAAARIPELSPGSAASTGPVETAAVVEDRSLGEDRQAGLLAGERVLPQAVQLAPAENRPAEAPLPKALLQLHAAPPIARPGGKVTIHWRIEELAEALDGLVLKLELPAGFVPETQAGWIFDREAWTLYLPTDASHGHVKLNVPGELCGSLLVAAFLLRRDEVLAADDLRLDEEGLSQLSKNGGQAEGLEGGVRITLPPGAADDDLKIRIRRAHTGAALPYSLSRRPFEIVAHKRSNGQAVSRFKKPITIEVAYTGEAEVQVISYYDERAGQWTPLPTEIDLEAGLLRARTDHLTRFDIQAESWQWSQMPTLDQAQVSPSTGSASYSYPIWTPPGPGGLSPSLALRYDSSIADAISLDTQASVVGMGWELNISSIERDMHGTMNDTGDDSFRLVLNGASSLLLKASDGRYHTQNESFLRIEQILDANDSIQGWIVTDKEGNVYEFGGEASKFVTFPAFSKTGQPARQEPWKWMLSTVKNRFTRDLAPDQGLTYTYTKNNETKQVLNPYNGGETGTVELAIYPQTIEYPLVDPANPGFRYRVAFVLEDRIDYDYNWVENPSSYRLFSRQRLSKILIQRNGATVRSFDLEYGEVIFPQHTWQHDETQQPSGHSFSLTRIWESNGTTGLPPVRFEYMMDGRLKNVYNGYGASVVYYYNSNPYRSSAPTPEWKAEYLFSKTNKTCSTTGWDQVCTDGDQGFLVVTNYADDASIPKAAVRPGRYYSIGATFVNNPGAEERARIGLDLGDGVKLYSDFIDVGVISTTEKTFVIPTSARQVIPFVECKAPDTLTPSTCWVNDFTLSSQLTHNRVATQVTNSPSSYNIDLTSQLYYDDPAVNDSLHSEAISTTQAAGKTAYLPAYSQFRGHRWAMTVGPDGKTTDMTWFHQDDALQGRPYRNQTLEKDYYQSFSQDPTTAIPDDGYPLPLLDQQWGTDGIAVYQTDIKDDDNVLKISNDVGSWRHVRRAGDTLQNGDMARLLFNLPADNDLEAVLTLESSDSAWGIYVDQARQLRARYSDKAGTVGSGVVIPSNALLSVKPDTWYELQLILDDHEEDFDRDGTPDSNYRIEVWEALDPQTSLRTFELELHQAAGQSWHLAAWANQGSFWIDGVFEGRLHRSELTTYVTDATFMTAQLYPDNPSPADELKFYWPRVVETVTKNHDGGKWTGSKLVHAYLAGFQGGSQYGNLTHTRYAYYDPAAKEWPEYRYTVNHYYPNPDRYLAGLPGKSNEYYCEGYCIEADSYRVSSTWYLYDGHHSNQSTLFSYQIPPSDGKLTAQRALLRVDGGQEKYADTLFGYDGYGNLTSVTKYKAEGDAAHLASVYADPLTQVETTSSHYPLENYYTFPVTETQVVSSTLSLTTAWAYDFDCAAPDSETGPNAGSTVQADYDEVCRLVRVAQPTDPLSSPTFEVFFHDTVRADQWETHLSSPTWVGFVQKTRQDGPNAPLHLLETRQYYSEIGELLQTQRIGAMVDGQPGQTIVSHAVADPIGRTDYTYLPFSLSGDPGGYVSVSPDRTHSLTRLDVLGRPTETYDSSDHVNPATRMEYRFLETRSFDINNKETLSSSDALGRLVSVQQPDQPAVEYRYDPAGRLWQVRRGRDGQGGVTETEILYDLAGRKTNLKDPDLGWWKYAYDALGNLTTQTDARGCTTTIATDLLNRPTHKRYSGEGCPAAYRDETVSYEYDDPLANGLGRLTGYTNSSGTTRLAYDERGQKVEEEKIIDGRTFTTRWEYDKAGQVTAMRYPAVGENPPERVVYDYLEQGPVASVTGLDAYVTNIQYNVFGQVVEQTYGSGLFEQAFEYFPWENTTAEPGYAPGLLRGIEAGADLNAPNLLDLDYTYFEEGNTETIADGLAGQTQHFTYDDAYRLEEAWTSGSATGAYAEEYGYAALTGNLATVVDRLANVTRSYNYPAPGSARPHAVQSISSSAGGQDSFHYDPNGNMDVRTVADQTYQLNYDAENRLRQATGAAGEEYSYDSLGNLVKSVNAAGTTYYVGDYYEQFQPAATPTETPTPTVTPTPTGPVGVTVGEYVELRFSGPASLGAGQPNPFTLQLDVTFTGPAGQTFVVPGFYDGDGLGGLDGDVWKARFAPDQPGPWQFTSDSPDPLLDDRSGAFTYAAPQDCPAYAPGDLPAFRCTGQLSYAGGHALRFANGRPWLKGGENDPEDFLAPGSNAGFPTKEQAIDYLAAQGANSLYLLLHNLDGDFDNVWPWLGATPTEAKTNPLRFDPARLAGWEALFTYIQSKGLVLHLVFEDDSAWTGFDRAAFYRQMAARFGHHRGLVWNLAEEYDESYTPEQVKTFAQMLGDLDPYDHPLTVHHTNATAAWLPFVGDARFDLASLQTSDLLSGLDDLSAAIALNQEAVDWFERVEAAGRAIPIGFDELEELAPAERERARRLAWAAYLGGGLAELHTYPLTGYQDYADFFADLRRARAFLEGLPYEQMRPHNERVVSGQAFVLEKPGQVYAAYLPAGGTVQLDLGAAGGTIFLARWLDPRTGAETAAGTALGGGSVWFSAPSAGDWALVLEADPGAPTPTPTATPSPAALPFVDAFDRPDGPQIGNGWSELEGAATSVELQAGQLCFALTGDEANRPQAQRAFAPVSSGELVWAFDFDWSRVLDETIYQVLLQLGNGAQMSDADSDAGVGVNLVWGNLGGTAPQLGYRQGGTAFPLADLSGAHRLTVRANLSSRTYTVAIDASPPLATLPFAADVTLDRVRLATDRLNESHFAGRCFDNLSIEQEEPPAPTCGGLAQEAEDGTLAGNFAVGSDTAASSGAYVHTPDLGVKLDDPSGSSAGYCVRVETAGTYRIQGWVYGPDLNNDSFFVRVDGSPLYGYLWDTLQNTSYAADYVNDRDTGADPLLVELGTGEHQLVFYQRDDGTRLDRFALERVAAPAVLLADDFARADGESLGNGWQEAEAPGVAEVRLQGGKLLFADSSDAALLPMAGHSFAAQTGGQLTWTFDFDWSRTGSEGTYRLYLQLGQASLMSGSDPDAGVGVNLVWTAIGGLHERLGYRKNGIVADLGGMSGAQALTVQVDLDARTYSVQAGGTTLGSGLPFDRDVAPDTVRFFTDVLNEANFAGRSLDNVRVEHLDGAPPTATPTPTATGTPTPTPTQTPTPTPTATASCGGLLQEAEDGTLAGSFVTGSDTAASSGGYVYTPDLGGKLDDPSGNSASYCFTVATAGTYRIKGWVYAPDGNGDSFFVRVDGSPLHGYLWDTLQNTSYAPDYVNDRDTAADPLQVSLVVGNHTVVVYQRDDGTRLDKLELERVTGGFSGGAQQLGLAVPGSAPAKATLVKLRHGAGGGLKKDRLLSGGAGKPFYAPAQAVSETPPAGMVVRKYYYAGGQRIALRVAGDAKAENNGLFFLLADHLGSASVMVRDDGKKTAELKYTPWGEARESGFTPSVDPTDRRYTGQQLFEGTGLYFYQSRWYDPRIKRWSQPDSIVPAITQGTQAFDRFAFVNNNTINHIDPDGHAVCDEWGYCYNQGRLIQRGHIANVALTTYQEGVRDVGGADARKIFDKYNQTPGWWNNYQPGSLTMTEFVGLWILHEASGDFEKAEILAQVIVQALYSGGYNPAYCDARANCTNGIFNYIAAQSQLSGGLFASANNMTGYSGPPGLGGNSSTITKAAELGAIALNPFNVIPAGPNSWGNSTSWSYAAQKVYYVSMDEVNGTALNTIYYYYESFIVFSVNQRNYWGQILNVDTSMDK
jgi:RHS repeat-associated protein